MVRPNSYHTAEGEKSNLIYVSLRLHWSMQGGIDSGTKLLMPLSIFCTNAKGVDAARDCRLYGTSVNGCCRAIH